MAAVFDETGALLRSRHRDPFGCVGAEIQYQRLAHRAIDFGLPRRVKIPCRLMRAVAVGSGVRETDIMSRSGQGPARGDAVNPGLIPAIVHQGAGDEILKPQSGTFHRIAPDPSWPRPVCDHFQRPRDRHAAERARESRPRHVSVAS